MTASSSANAVLTCERPRGRRELLMQYRALDRCRTMLDRTPQALLGDRAYLEHLSAVGTRKDVEFPQSSEFAPVIVDMHEHLFAVRTDRQILVIT